MKKVFLSADIEGTCGIAHWDETLPDKRDYPRFQEQMTREVAAACEGLGAEGVTDIFGPGCPRYGAQPEGGASAGKCRDLPRLGTRSLEHDERHRREL